MLKISYLRIRKMISISNLLDATPNFDSLTQREQVKLLSYFYCVSKDIEDFSSAQVKRCFEENGLSMPANVTHELNKLSSQKPAILNKKNSNYSFHRTAKKELDSKYLNSKELVKSQTPDEKKKDVELFNCYIRVGENKQVIPTLDKNDIEKIFMTIEEGGEKVFINGRYIEIKGFNTFKIYDFCLRREISSKGDAKRLMEIERDIIGTKWGIPVFKHFGVDVTDQFEIPESRSSAQKNDVEWFVDLDRIEELRKIVNPNFDLTRLIKKCEELNNSYSNGSFFSTSLLTRSIIDHIAPIFGKANFSEVSGSHGSKSFKESMSHLDKSSRKIADAYLHTHIRNKEVLPNKTQVNFSRDLDVLLAEIVRVLKK